MIKSLQGLRALAMLAIFLFHSGLFLNGVFPVTFFFILSGFVLYYNYNDKVNDDVTIKESIAWGITKIKKMYPIHLVTFIISVFIRWEWVIGQSIKEVIIKGGTNLLLLQSMSPEYALTFNNASWYLSTTFICYLFILLLIKGLRRKKNNKILLVGVWCCQLGLAIILPYLVDDYNYVLYMSPYMRIMDVSLGMILAKMYMEREDRKNINYNFYEVLSLGLFLVVYIISFELPTQFTRGVIYSPVFLLGMYFLSYEKGYLSKLLCKPILQKLASISFEFYMIHELVLIFFRRVFENVTTHWLIRNITIAIPSFVLALLLAVIFKKCLSKRDIKSRR